MRIAIDIDSTLHHYWDVLSRAAERRFGISLPYEEQVTWGITRLRPEQLELCIAETHNEENVLAGRPYPNAVQTIGRWHGAGHFIHITSHRTPASYPATEHWLRRIGLPYDELYCSRDKVARCRQLEIDVLIDDSPLNLMRAAEHGIVPATIVHPWNRDLCEEEDVVFGRDWFELERRLAPVLGTASSTGDLQPPPDDPGAAQADPGQARKPASTEPGLHRPESEAPARGERRAQRRRRQPGTRRAIDRARAAVRRRAA